jgi:hypothetical protein
MKLIPLLLELEYRTYEAMVQVTFGDDEPKGYDDGIRALPGVTTCTVASEDSESKKATYKVKIISQKEPAEAFEALKANAKAKYSGIVSVEVGEQTIEEK